MHRGNVIGGQGGQHLRHCQPQCGMQPIGGNFGQGNQHKGTILQPGMRQDQPVGGKPDLIISGQIAPPGLRACIGQQRAPYRQQINVQCPAAPACDTFPTESGLDGVQMRQYFVRRDFVTWRHHGCGIHIVRPRPGRETRRAIKPAKADFRVHFRSKQARCRNNQRFWRQIAEVLIRAKCNQSVLFSNRLQCYATPMDRLAGEPPRLVFSDVRHSDCYIR